MVKHTWIAERRAELEVLAIAPMVDRPAARIESKTWEYAITNRLNDPIGFIDMRVELGVPQIATAGNAWRAAFTTLEVCFEAKSHISSLGELFRQIRMYQAHMPRARFIVVSPDDRFADTLRAQGIGFVKYEPEA